MSNLLGASEELRATVAERRSQQLHAIQVPCRVAKDWEGKTVRTEETRGTVEPVGSDKIRPVAIRSNSNEELRILEPEQRWARSTAKTEEEKKKKQR